jgi:hypothetical protein
MLNRCWLGVVLGLPAIPRPLPRGCVLDPVCMDIAHCGRNILVAGDFLHPVSIQINLVLIKRIFSGKELKFLGDSRRIVSGVVKN